MIQNIPLEKLPNQSLTIRLQDHRYEIELKTISDDLMSISITRDNINLIRGIRCVPQMFFLPKHLEMGLGNFYFLTVNDEYPNCQKFGSDHVLYYSDEV
ncbi:hypothetical protein FHU10_5148 [Serratia fonticola]|uniref:Cyanophage baseplate Pam3 plug gp18 domain-containing protein n=1 Tax=Serratia fonticola TaxID=47917 RepID=A0A559TCX6_SERFO|nr:hypothetical protein [Serratia fonticola]TQI80001.1 hypothetical protein FHU09_2556 [Serratia fonticola]TQI97973.1 hypothetical protein FHU11_3490 [Serratia fonticola]TVZ72468.1 hypothetical protein FHU10_5148 [Serratia fonticola]